VARELGLNPKKFGRLANHKQEPRKLPLPIFIEELYFKRFKMGDNALIQPNLPGWLGWIHETRWDNIFPVTICKRENEIKHHRV
jgi:hypothetical protein